MVSDNFICYKCKNNAELIKNQRADASYEYLIYCRKCNKELGIVRFDGRVEIKTDGCYDKSKTA